MKNFVFVLGSDIYDAAVEGAKRGYNRSTNDLTTYSKVLREEYELLIANSTSDKRKQNKIRKNTKNNWRFAVMPLVFVLYHDHILFEPSERHVRVKLIETNVVFDIPLKSWEAFEAIST